jgi:hypothetical protein
MDKVGFTYDSNYDWCNFPKRKHLDNSTLTISIEKDGDEIPGWEERKKGSKKKL